MLFLCFKSDNNYFPVDGCVYCIVSLPPQAVFVIWVCAYVSLGMALYGSVSHNFSSVATAMQSVTGLLTRHYRFDEMEGTRDFWTTLGWRLFVVSFLLLALGSLTAYVSRLNWHIMKRLFAKLQISKKKKKNGRAHTTHPSPIQTFFPKPITDMDRTLVS